MATIITVQYKAIKYSVKIYKNQSVENIVFQVKHIGLVISMCMLNAFMTFSWKQLNIRHNDFLLSVVLQPMFSFVTLTLPHWILIFG